MKYAYIHPDCGKPAFLLSEMPKLGELMKPSIACHLDGSPIKYGEYVTCDSCGRRIHSPSIRNIVEWKDG